MSESESRALVPVAKKPPATIKRQTDIQPLALLNGKLHIENREQVRQYLPEILGRVLARVWIDNDFHTEFSGDPQATLEKHGLSLPASMSIEYEKPNTNRPRIVVYERPEGSKFKMRIFYLQLVMMAGR